MTVAEKYINDIPYVNTHYATFGGVSLDELNCLEVKLLFVLKWRLGVSPEEYNQKHEAVRRAFMEALSASEATNWIVLNEAVCEVIDEKQRRGSESSLQGSTITGGESAKEPSSDTSTDSSEAVSVVTDNWVGEEALQDEMI
jgi:hypothetical protein